MNTVFLIVFIRIKPLTMLFGAFVTVGFITVW